ncbi:MAG: ATP-binding cassette domain-containing protein [Bacteroidetes bacterium]|nr:ATP-binding cassette domain-containing protein [Bacteroidota bacterium]
MLTVHQLRKKFNSVYAVDGVSFTVSRGEVFGLLGPNGAGKTTTIRTILHIILPDSGTILFDGKPFSKELWNKFGYLPEERGLYRKSRVLDTILYFSSLKGMHWNEVRSKAFLWLDRFGLLNDGHRKIEELSKGNQQKVQLILAFLHSPQLLILDEPFSGLDPLNQQQLKDIILELRTQNIAIIFSTHQMEQVEKLCDTICLINKGREVVKGALADVKRQYGTNTIHIEFEGDASILARHPLVSKADIYQRYAEVELNDITYANEFLHSLPSTLIIKKYEIQEPSLHSIFIQVVGRRTEGLEK